MRLCIPNFSWDVVSVDIGLLEKHVQTSLILGQGMTGDSKTKLVYVIDSIFASYLLTNPSKPDRLSSMKSSSNIPSSLRNGICLLRALLGRGGTTIYIKIITKQYV